MTQHRTFFMLLKVSLGYSMVMWGLIELFPQTFAAIFTPDPTLQTFAAKMLRIYCGGLGIFGAQMACQMTFVAIGYAKSSVIVAVMRKIVLLIPLIYLMPAIFTADKTRAVYMAEPVADVLAVAFTVALFTVQFGRVMRELRGKGQRLPE